MMNKMKLINLRQKVTNFIKREDGASAIEYALIAGLIAIAIIATAGGLGAQISEVFSNITSALTGAVPSSTSSP
ncbi:Flp family type IVb pilin [Pseudomonas sp. WN033]|nr:Flp family type IVb pilin [Pseudomonas sp. WN033]